MIKDRFFFKRKEYTKKWVFQKKPQAFWMYSEHTYHQENSKHKKVLWGSY